MNEDQAQIEREKFLLQVYADAGFFPIMIFSRNLRSWLGSSISTVTSNTYNHFMWQIDYSNLATQDNFWHKESIFNYMQGEHILKFVVDTRWTVQQRIELLEAMDKDLAKPFYNRAYDYLAIFGQAIHQPWIQIPWLDICSERGKYLRITDSEYRLKHPSPGDINTYQKEHQETEHEGGYKVIGRWLPIDF